MPKWIFQKTSGDQQGVTVITQIVVVFQKFEEKPPLVFKLDFSKIKYRLRPTKEKTHKETSCKNLFLSTKQD